MLGSLLTSRTVRRFVASSPRGRSRVARLISRHYPKAKIFSLVGPFAQSSMYLDTSDPFQADMAFGAYQPSAIDAIFRLARPNDVVLTAGAQMGFVALAPAPAARPGGTGGAFEAEPLVI